MKAKEILNILSKPWCSNQDIMTIADLSASTASKVKRTIELEFRKKNPNRFLPSNRIPTCEVIKFFNLDIEFLKGLASIDLSDNEE